jgi:hypothetical protein
MAIETPPLEEIIKQWDKDSVIDQTEPGKEIIRIPILQNKYNKYLTLHALSGRKVAIEFDKLKKLKWEYYSGKLDEEQLTSLGWEPFRFILKTDINIYLDADDDLNKLRRKKFYHEKAADFCENVMKELNSRTFQLRAFMDWEKFIQGAR